MFRFTLRDMLWLTALIGLAIAWWVDQRKLAAVRQERDEAVALWHDASNKWVEATSKIPPRKGGFIGPAASIPANPQPAKTGGGLGGAIVTPQSSTPTRSNLQSKRVGDEQ